MQEAESRLCSEAESKGVEVKMVDGYAADLQLIFAFLIITKCFNCLTHTISSVQILKISLVDLATSLVAMVKASAA